MSTIPALSVVFTAIAVIFLVVTFQDYLKATDKLTPARKTWLRIALIFAIVGIGLSVLRILSP